jgi:hypothetical protein
MRSPEQFRASVVVSLLAAFSSCFGPHFFSPYTTNFDRVIFASWCLSAFWALLLCRGLIAYHRRGLWLLIGAPLALYYPCLFLMWMRACRHDVNACP